MDSNFDYSAHGFHFLFYFLLCPFSFFLWYEIFLSAPRGFLLPPLPSALTAFVSFLGEKKIKALNSPYCSHFPCLPQPDCNGNHNTIGKSDFRVDRLSFHGGDRSIETILLSLFKWFCLCLKGNFLYKPHLFFWGGDGGGYYNLEQESGRPITN